MTRLDPTPPVGGRYGAPMGRSSRTQGDVLPSDPPLYLRRVPIDRGGYDSGGAYWGLGEPLWWCANDAGDIDTFFRAASREKAKAVVRENYPDARFFR